MKIKSCFFVVFVLFLACQKKNNEDKIIKGENSQDVVKVKEDLGSFEINEFDYGKDTISGCNHIANYSNKGIENNVIYMSNITDFAIVKINGEKLVLKRDTIDSKMINEKKYIYVFKGKNCKTTLIMNLDDSLEEEFKFDGTLEIDYKNSKKKIQISGQGGC